MNHYVEIPASDIHEAMQQAGFQAVPAGGQEIAYRRAHQRDPRLQITVYTSIGSGGSHARGCGEDAIRVLGQFIWEHRTNTGTETRRKNLYKAKILRVNSVPGTVDRMVEAARDAWVACNRYHREHLVKQTTSNQQERRG